MPTTVLLTCPNYLTIQHACFVVVVAHPNLQDPRKYKLRYACGVFELKMVGVILMMIITITKRMLMIHNIVWQH
jgi:hypothetical protein